MLCSFGCLFVGRGLQFFCSGYPVFFCRKGLFVCSSALVRMYLCCVRSGTSSEQGGGGAGTLRRVLLHPTGPVCVQTSLSVHSVFGPPNSRCVGRELNDSIDQSEQQRRQPSPNAKQPPKTAVENRPGLCCDGGTDSARSRFVPFCKPFFPPLASSSPLRRCRSRTPRRWNRCSTPLATARGRAW